MKNTLNCVNVKLQEYMFSNSLALEANSVCLSFILSGEFEWFGGVLFHCFVETFW